MSPYQVLGLAPGADAAQVKSAWRKRSRETHPDVGGDPLEFQRVQEAYRTLKTVAGSAEAGAHSATGTTGFTASSQSARSSHERSGTETPSGARTSSTGGASQGSSWQPRPSAARQAPKPAAPPAPPTMTVEPSRLSWASTRPAQDVTVTPVQRRWLAAAPTVAGVVGVAMSSLGLVGAARAQALGLAALGTALLVLVACGALLTRWWWAGTTAVSVVLLFGFAALPDQPSAAALLVGGVALALGGALAHAVRAYSSPALLDQVVSHKTAVEFNSFGKPGSPGTLDTAETRMGARMGDDALVLLTWFPGVRTFHGVPFDASGRATSHVIVCGDKVAVVDSLVWLPGSYAFSAHGALLHNGLHFVYGDVDIHDATRAWRDRMGAGAQVRSWFMIGSAHGPVAVIDPVGPDSASGARAGTPQQVLEEVGSWFAEGRTDLVDRRVLFKVAQQLLGA